MFDFLTPRAWILKQCANEVQRIASASFLREIQTAESQGRRAELLAKAQRAGLAATDDYQRLHLLHRLINGISGDDLEHDGKQMDSLLREASRLGVQDVGCVKVLREHRDRHRVEEQGPKAIAEDSAGRAVFLRVAAEYKNRPGSLEVRDDGLTFEGEVKLEIAWANVAHVAKTTHTFQGLDYDAVAVQEGKRRTATKFAFAGEDARKTVAVILAVWKRRPAASENG